MKNNTTHEIDIDMRALSLEDPDMYERIVNIFVKEGAQFLGLGIVDYDALEKIASKILYIKCYIRMTGDSEITAEVSHIEIPANTEIFHNGNEAYSWGDVLGFAYIADMSMFANCWEKNNDRIAVYKYIVDRAGLEICNFELVEKMITGIEKECIS